MKKPIKQRDWIAVCKKNGYPEDFECVYDRTRGGAFQAFYFKKKYKGHRLKEGPFVTAKLAHSQLKAEMERVDDGKPSLRIVANTMTLRELIDKLERMGEFNDWQKSKRDVLNNFRGTDTGNIHLSAITEDIICKLIRKYKDTKTHHNHYTSTKTIRNKIYVLSNLLALGMRKKLLGENVVKNMIDGGQIKTELRRYQDEKWQRFKYTDRKLRRILEREAMKVFSRGRRVIDERTGKEIPNQFYRIALIVILTVELGLRTGELLSLKMKNDGSHNYIDWLQKWFFFYFGMHKSHSCVFRDGRRAILNSRVMKILENVPKNQEYLIEPRMEADACYVQFRRFVNSVDVSFLSPDEQKQFKSIRARDLRISVATDLTNRAIIKAKCTNRSDGSTLSIIAEHLGHRISTLLENYNTTVGRFNDQDLDIFREPDDDSLDDNDDDDLDDDDPDDPAPACAVAG